MSHALIAFCLTCLRLVIKTAVFFLKVMLWMVPTAGAVVALMGLYAWVLGIPGSSTPDYYRPWLLGLLVLGGYLGAYGLYLVMALAGRFAQRPRLYYASTVLLWICLIVASAVMQGVWTQLFGGR